MTMRGSRCAAAFIALVSLMGASCSGGEDGFRSPISTISTRSLQLTAEPAAIVPQFLSNPFCTTRPPFRAGLTLFLTGRSRVLRAVVFEFSDRFGVRSVPTSIATASSLPSTSPVQLPASVPIPLPASAPIPLPAGSPIPIPGTLPFNGFVLDAPRNLPVLLEFACGVNAAGTLFVSVESTDDRGMTGVSKIGVRIGG